MTDIFEPAVSTFIFENASAKAEASLQDASLSINELRQIKEAGFNLIELWGRKPHFDFMDISAVRKIKTAAASLGIKIASIHSPFGEGYDLSSCDNEIRQAAVRGIINCISVLEELEADTIVVHAGIRIKEGGDKGPFISSAKKSLDAILKVCEKKKKTLALENMLSGIVGDNSEELWRLVNSFPSIYIGICLDTGHAYIGGELIHAVQKFQSRLITLHISDNSGMADEHLLPGEGNIEWEQFLAALAQASYEGLFMYELIKREDNLSVLKNAKSIYEKFKVIFKENLV